MSDHATVIEIRGEWNNGICQHQLGLELPDGPRVAMPFGLDANPGDVLAVITEAEFLLIQTHRVMISKGKRA